MSIWNAKTTLEGRRECRRCHRMFLPKKPDDMYGPTCARKLAGQVELDSMALVSGKVLKA